jgi:hypothetical protein
MFHKNLILAILIFFGIFIATVGSLFLNSLTIYAQEAVTETEEQAEIKTDCNDVNVNAENCEIVRYLLIFINALSAIVGVVIVGVITAGGIQYSAAGDNPQATLAAKKRIGNAILALLLYIFMFAFLQWIVPGGVF